MINFSGQGVAGILAVALLVLNIVVVITFFVTAGHVAKLHAEWSAANPAPFRVCWLCYGPTVPQASVCRHCGRDIGVWREHGGSWWMSKDGQWAYLDRGAGQWRPADGEHPAPLT